MRWISISIFILVVGLIVLLAFTGNRGVVDPLNIQDDAVSPAGNLVGDQAIGQTFVAHSPRLSAIQVRWVVSDDFAFAPDSRVTFHLRHRVDDFADLATASIPLAEIRHNQFSTFDFAPIPDSRAQSYYFFLDASHAEITRGWLSVWASEDDVLPDGQMYFDGGATDRDLAFRVFCAPDFFVGLDALGKTFAREWVGIPIAALIFLIPGLALQLSFRAKREISTEMLARVGGLSLAMLSAASLVLLWLQVSVAWLVVVIFVLALAARVSPLPAIASTFPLPSVNSAKQSPNSSVEIASPHPSTRFARSGSLLAMTMLSALALLSLIVAFIQVAELPVPLWVDSYAHASYIKGFLDHGHPPLASIYHLGYHSIVALLVQLSGMSIPQAMLLVGQLIVVQIGLSFFLFGRRLSGSMIVGFGSAIGVWFLTPTPMYFITWGRYPLLLGIAVLPIALISAMDLIEPPRFDVRAYLLAVITLAGLAFAHIRLLAFYVVFVAIYFAWQNWRARRPFARAGRIALLAVAGSLIGMFWLAALASQRDVAQDLAAHVAIASDIDLATALAVMQSHYGPILWAIAPFGVVVALVRRTRSALIVAAWFAALLAIAALQILIGVQMLDGSFVVLMAFFPAALLIAELARALFTKNTAVGLLVCLLVSLLGAREMLSIVNPTTVLFTRADERAMVWIQANTPDDARFLVNSFAWLPSYYVPSDGGSWIPYTTNRAMAFVDNATAPDALARWIDAQQITYVYLGRRAGVLPARDFTDAPERYQLVYEEEGVRIFGVKIESIPLSNSR